MKIVLASASPQRKKLLEMTGLPFEVDPSDYREDMTLELSPHELARHVSREKARAVAARHPGALIIAVDTFGVFRGRVLGKPGTEAEARRMLRATNGKMHRVITGFTILDTATGRSVSQTVETKVYFRRLAVEEIEEYVRTGEPLDKAGAYAIQGLGAFIVRRIEGDFYNVIGLPLNALAESLKEFGVNVLRRETG